MLSPHQLSPEPSRLLCRLAFVCVWLPSSIPFAQASTSPSWLEQELLLELEQLGLEPRQLLPMPSFFDRLRNTPCN